MLVFLVAGIELAVEWGTGNAKLGIKPDRLLLCLRYRGEAFEIA